MSELATCQFCTRILTPSIRVYSCFANACADCIDRRLANDPDVAIDRQLQALFDDLPVHRVELTPEQLEQVRTRERLRAIDSSFLWTPFTREDALLVLQLAFDIFEARMRSTPVPPSIAVASVITALRDAWRKPEPEGALL